MSDRPVVSVWVFTFNHARFIGQCLDSILMHGDYGIRIRAMIRKRFF